jgi:Hint domain
MQELEAHLAKARFARRHLSRMAGIGVAALIARLTMPTPAQAWGGDHDHDWGGRGRGGGDPSCFLKGTKVQTITGERAVEDLAVGDLLPTHVNRVQPVQWICRYQFRRSDASRPWTRALPVRVARSALADDVPHADLYVSQLHGILVDGVLVRAGSLVNGKTIALHDPGDVSELEYYHIKLQSHDVIYAEGAPCETFSDVEESAADFVPVLSFTGSRSKMRSHLRSALSPLVDRREKIDIIRDRLEERALTPG